MVNYQLTHEMKPHAAIVVTHAKHGEVEFVPFLDYGRLFVHKIWKHPAKLKKHFQHLDSIRTPQIV